MPQVRNTLYKYQSGSCQEIEDMDKVEEMPVKSFISAPQGPKTTNQPKHTSLNNLKGNTFQSFGIFTEAQDREVLKPVRFMRVAFYRMNSQ